MNYLHPERCVFLGNIPYIATEEDVTPILQSIGPIIKLELKKDPKTGSCSGIGFCEFADEYTAREAKKLNNTKRIKGRLLRIDNPDGGKKGVAAATSESYITRLSRDECYTFLINMQMMIKDEPETARRILIDYPNIFSACEELLNLNRLY